MHIAQTSTENIEHACMLNWTNHSFNSSPVSCSNKSHNLLYSLIGGFNLKQTCLQSAWFPVINKCCTSQFPLSWVYNHLNINFSKRELTQIGTSSIYSSCCRHEVEEPQWPELFRLSCSSFALHFLVMRQTVGRFSFYNLREK